MFCIHGNLSPPVGFYKLIFLIADLFESYVDFFQFSLLQTYYNGSPFFRHVHVILQDCFEGMELLVEGYMHLMLE